MRDSIEYSKIILKEMFSRFFSKLDVLQSSKDEELIGTFLTELCNFEMNEEKLNGFKLTADGKFIRETVCIRSEDKVTEFRTWFQIVEKVIDFLITDTDLIIVCCWTGCSRTGAVNRVNIATMFYLVAVEGFDFNALKVNQNDRKL